MDISVKYIPYQAPIEVSYGH